MNSLGFLRIAGLLVIFVGMTIGSNESSAQDAHYWDRALMPIPSMGMLSW